MERNAMLGDYLGVYTWETDHNGITIKTEFVVDQERARQQGLMSP